MSHGEKDHIYAVNECLCNHLKMELTMNEIFTLLKEITILSQAPNNVGKNQYSSPTSQSIDTFSSVVISVKSSWGLTAVN